MALKHNPTLRRNVVFVGQSHVGKTALAESILFTAGATTRIGKTEDGSSHFDFEEEEIKHHATLKEAVYEFKLGEHAVGIIDTPGSSDFIADTQCALRAADTALLVVGALSGIKVQGEKAWGLACQEGVARAIFVGELDKENANAEGALNATRETLHINPIVVQFATEDSAYVIDALTQQAYAVGNDAKGTVSAVPPKYQAQLDSLRAKLVESIAETDDVLLEKYLEGTSLEAEELVTAFRRAFARGAIVPVFTGSPITRLGMNALLDALKRYFPSPVERTPYPVISEDKGFLVANPEKPFVGLIFKTFADPFTGHVSLCRVVQGVLRSEDTVLNTRNDERERVGKLNLQLGREQEMVEEVGAGGIVALSKLKNTHTGDTLCDLTLHTKLEGFHFPEPSISFAIDPKTRKDEEKIFQAMQSIAEEDPSIAVRRDPATHETLISGQSESQIAIILERIWRKYHVEGILHTPKIPYRETITIRAEAQGRHKKQTGGHGQFGDCWLRLAPGPRGSGFTFKNEVFGGAIPRNYIPAVEKGVVEALEEGFVAGYPLVDIECTVYDGSYHAVDSSELSFKLAAQKGIKAAIEKARPILLEPIMLVEVTVPDEYTGAVMGDLNGHRGRVHDLENRGESSLVTAYAPMAEMLTYSATLRSMTGDRGSFHVQFMGYEEVPASIAERLVPQLISEREAREAREANR